MAGETIQETLYGLLEAGWRRRYLIVIPVLVLPFLGFGVGKMLPKNYISSTSVLINETASMNPLVEDLQISTNLKERQDALDTLLHSRHVLNQVVEDLGWVTEETPAKDRVRMINDLSHGLTFNLVGSDLIELQYKAPIPDEMDKVLIAVTKRFLVKVLAPSRSAITDTEGFLKTQLESRRADLERSERRLAEYKTAHADELPELHSANVKNLSNLRQSLDQRRTDLAGARAKLSNMKQRLAQTNPVIGKLEERIVSISGELALLRARYTDEHSKVVSAMRKLERLETERESLLNATNEIIEHPDEVDEERLWNLASSMREERVDGSQMQPLLVSQLEELQSAQGKVKSLEQEVEALEQAVTKLSVTVAAFGHNERRLAEMQRDMKVNRELYETLLKRFEMARVTGELGRYSETDLIKVIDHPSVPLAPTNLPAIVFAIAGIFGGIGLGIGLALFAEIADPSIRRRYGLEDITGVPVLSRIPPLPHDGFTIDGEIDGNGLSPA